MEMDVEDKNSDEKEFSREVAEEKTEAEEESIEAEEEDMEAEEEMLVEDEANEQADEKASDDSDSDSSDDDSDEKEIQFLEANLVKNLYDYTSHVTLIQKFQKMGELERLRAAREKMNSVYPLSPELWLAWIHDEINVAITSEQKPEVVKVCERAIKDYLSVEVWLEYLQFSIGNMGTEKDAAKNVRELFERALSTVALHTLKGAIIWEAFREFETVLSALVDTTIPAEKKEQLGRVGSLFHRQLTCPLLNMEKTYEEYKLWRAKEGAEADIDDKIISRDYKEASVKLNLLLPYEERLISAQSESELLDIYKGYLSYEKENSNPARVILLYERAVTDLSLEVSIWIDYITYLEDKIKVDNVLEPVYQRASRNVPWCSKIWQKWIRSCEKWEKPVLEVQSILENALTAGFSTAEDYRNLWITYLEYLRRRYDQVSEEEKKRLDILLSTFNRACEHLAKCFGLDGDPNCVILQYWARTEAIHANNMERARTLWADILSQGHSATASYWLEYISLERCCGNTKHLRKLYQKALASVKDWPESIANVWIDFERDEGTLEQMEFCEAKTKEKLDEVAKERQKAQQTAVQSESLLNKKASKRKSDDIGKWKNLNASQMKIMKSDRVQAKSVSQKSSFNIDNNADNNEKNHDTKSKVAPPPGFKVAEDKDADTDNQHEVDNDVTVFISNLEYAATEEQVRDALKPAGPITLFKMVKDYKGRSKGFCYVQLSSTEAVEKALKLDRTMISGRPMFVSRCEPNKSNRSSGFKYNCTLEKNKLFVKGLPVTMTKEELEEIFHVHGALKEVRLVTYRNGHSKGLAYVEYHDEAVAAKALLNTDGMKIQDRVISVAISKPPDRKKTDDSDGHIRSLGGSSISRTAFGVPKTLLSMVPRNVKTTTSKASSSKSGANGTGNGVAQSMSNQDFRNMFLSKK